MPDRDMEIFNEALKNFTQAVMIFDKQDRLETKKLEEFLAQMKTVFEFIDSLDYTNAQELMTKKFDPSNLATSVMLIADAHPKERWILKQYRNLLLNRLNSFTKNRKLIYDILVYYFMQFLNCLEDHSNNSLTLQRMMILTALGVQTQASRSFAEFVQGPLSQALHDKKSELEKGMKGGSQNWQNNAVK